MPKPTVPLLIYDGDCSFCRLWVDRWKLVTQDRVDYAPFQEVASQFPEIPLEQFKAAVQLIEPSGEVYRGAHAVFRLLLHAPGKGWMYWAYQHVPGAAIVFEALYRFVAAHRPLLYTLTCLLWGRRFERPSYELTRWLCLRLLAVIFFVAFLSLHVQVPGLIGSRGILPAGDFLSAVQQSLGRAGYWSFPTLAWITASDSGLRVLSLGGIVVSLAALCGVLPVFSFAILWLFYLSLVIVGQDFLSFQWDILLAETGFLAVFLAPRRAPPSRAVLWLLRFLLFRLVFSSGAGKLATGDPTWRALTALNYHYETQPLPTPLAWFMHQLPGWFQKFSTLFALGVEVFVPFLIFAPRRIRFAGAGLLVLLQVLILLTGNYAFFNWLSIALCVPLLDDAFLRRFLPAGLVGKVTAGRYAVEQRRVGRVLIGALAVTITLAGGIQVARRFWDFDWLPAPAARVLDRLTRLHVVSGYGLFTVMTTSRPEIVVEGSNDGETWLEYEFQYKPGDLKRLPPVVAPHQPRLDWQMWFAALGDYRDNPWFVNFMVRLLEGSPDVLALLEKNPFPNGPPRYVRASRYDYHFTDFVKRRTEGAWWRRTFTGLYFPAASLK